VNPNYLLKGALQYELRIRGISSDADVHTLCRLFRSVVSEGLQVYLGNLSSLGVEELHECVVSKIVELQSLVRQQESGLSLLTPRFSTRFSHLRGRLIHLTTLGIVPPNTTRLHYQELHEQLDLIQRNITTTLDMTDRQSQEKEEQDDRYNMAQGVSRTRPRPLAGKVEDTQDPGNVSTVMVAVNRDTGALSAQVAQANAGISTAGSQSVGQNDGQVFPPHFYHRLPHFVKIF
jgi:hypothetical protein